MSPVSNVNDDWQSIGIRLSMHMNQAGVYLSFFAYICLYQFLWHDATCSIFTPIFTPRSLIMRLLREI